MYKIKIHRHHHSQMRLEFAKAMLQAQIPFLLEMIQFMEV